MTMPDSHDILDLIARRHSWRTYNGLKLDSSLLGEVKNAIADAARFATAMAAGTRFTADGEIQHPEPPIIRLADDPAFNGAIGTYGFIKGARHFLVLLSGTDTASRVVAAMAMEYLILQLTGLGLSTCWLGGTFSRKKFASLIGEESLSGREIAAVSPVGHRAPTPRLAERMFRSFINETKRKPFGQLFQGVEAPGSFSYTTSPSQQVAVALEAVRLGPSARNIQPWRGIVAPDGTVRLSCATHNAYSALDMGIATTHFLLAAHRMDMRYSTHIDTSDARPVITFAPAFPGK